MRVSSSVLTGTPLHVLVLVWPHLPCPAPHRPQPPQPAHCPQPSLATPSRSCSTSRARLRGLVKTADNITLLLLVRKLWFASIGQMSVCDQPLMPGEGGARWHWTPARVEVAVLAWSRAAKQLWLELLLGEAETPPLLGSES